MLSHPSTEAGLSRNRLTGCWAIHFPPFYALDLFVPLNLPAFIAGITGRPESLLRDDLLLHRDALSAAIGGKKILVIGGAGTIGSSFIKALLPYRPAALYVVDTNENGLTELVRDLRSTPGLYVPPVLVTYPLSFSQPVFEKFFRSQAPFEIVANFAAHKHVRSEKDLISIEAMLENNVLSAKHLLDLLLERPPEHFFAVSTDKAANPVNVMGASKKLMEDVILAYSAYFSCTTARFANVAFSNGSLLFGFLERLMKRQPLSVPSDIRRFFVSPEESGQLCLLACVLGRSGEVFFPKLDPEKDLISFRDITLQFLAAMGYEAAICNTEEEARQKSLSLQTDTPAYPVYFFESDTSGEKPYEEFFTEREKLDLTRFSALGVIEELPRKSLQEIAAMVQSLRAFFAETGADKQGLVERIAQYVADFEHIERGKNLDQKM